jgi:hypothetical protein
LAHRSSIFLLCARSRSWHHRQLRRMV